jgi:hydrogenase maturation factor
MQTEENNLRFPFGKIPPEILKEIIFENLGFKRKDVILGPSIGFDGAIIDIGEKSLIASMDPITGAVEHIGWLAVHINANDIATFGVEPAFFLSCILLPEKTKTEIIKKISIQMDKAAKELKIAIIGGHCEVTPGLDFPLVIGCTLGVAEKGKYVTAGGAKPGDKLILTKTGGIEGTAILATEKEKLLKEKLSSEIVEKAQKFYEKISVVKDAITAFRTGGVNAMHDPTEGGVVGGIHEMADASDLGVEIFEEKIPVEPETRKICEFFQIDPLQLISSGALLISVESNSADRIIENLKKQGIQSSLIGKFLENPRKRLIIKSDRSIQTLPRPLCDHLWLALKNPADPSSL